MARSTESFVTFKYGFCFISIQIEFNGTPKTMKRAIDEARINTETLQTYVHKINEKEYMKRLMKRLNTELSPMRDESTRDPFFIRNMWEHYQRNKVFEQSTSK